VTGMPSKIYRLWLVWSRSWPVIVLPSALLILDFVGFVITLRGLGHSVPPALAHATITWLEPVLFLGEALTNVLCSGRWSPSVDGELARTDARQP
jgi:hypothetical protein